MKVDIAFEDVTALSIDTAPLIYFVERNPKYLRDNALDNTSH